MTEKEEFMRDMKDSYDVILNLEPTTRKLVQVAMVSVKKDDVHDSTMLAIMMSIFKELRSLNIKLEKLKG